MKRILTVTIMLMLFQVLVFGCKTVSPDVNSSGTIFVVDIVPDGHETANKVERSVKILQSRLNAIRIDGVVKQTSGNRLEVKVFRAPDPAKIRNFLFKTYNLELRKVVSPPSPHPVEMFPNEEKANAAAVAGQLILPYSEREEGSGQTQFLVLERDSVITGEHIRDAQAVSRTGFDSDYLVSFTLTPDGAEKFGEWTGRNINNYLAVVLNGKVQSVAFIRSQISDMGEINGNFSKAQAEEIALILSSGYMPWELKVVEERKF